MKTNLTIHFDPSTDLRQWRVGPPYLQDFRIRKVATAHILNTGNKILEECAAFLEIIKSDVFVSTQRQLPLHWADTPYDALSSSIARIKISPSMEHRLDIAFSEECQGVTPGCSIASAQALATGVQIDQFYLKPGKYLVRVTVVSNSGDKVQKKFVIQSSHQWQDLNMQSVAESLPSNLLGKWHSFHLSGLVITALATIGAAVIAGIFLLVNTIIDHYFSKTEPQEKTTMSVPDNAGSVQQQSAKTIINNPTTLILSKASVGDDEDFERKLASGLYSYFVSVKDRLEKKQSVDTERIRTYLASNRFFPLDIHRQIGNLLTSIENSNYEAATDQVKDIVSKIGNRYGIKLSETQLGSGPAVSADTLTVLSNNDTSNSRK